MDWRTQSDDCRNINCVNLQQKYTDLNGGKEGDGELHWPCLYRPNSTRRRNLCGSKIGGVHAQRCSQPSVRSTVNPDHTRPAIIMVLYEAQYDMHKQTRDRYVR